MIIREYNKEFIMIEQNHHAHLSAEIITYWQEIFLLNDPYSDSVLYAIKQHDYGWDPFDKQPFWNDETKAPYSFIDFPVLPKTVLYTQGVDKTEEIDPYAAALCSAHYMRFMENNTSLEAQDYMKHEKQRTKRISTDLASDHDQFDKHLALLQFADNISLYICLNEPLVSQSNVHYFFKSGIPISKKINQIKTNYIQADWLDNETISLTGLPLVPSFDISLKQKKLSKQLIKEKGLNKAYQATPYEYIKINFKTS